MLTYEFCHVSVHPSAALKIHSKLSCCNLGGPLTRSFKLKNSTSALLQIRNFSSNQLQLNHQFNSYKQTKSRSFSSTMLSSQQSTSPQNNSESDVISETINGKGIITLNRPKVLNALNLSMIRKITPLLRAWESTQKFVIIKAAGGKAFCAGGDIRTVTESAQAGTSLCSDFFREEYKLNALIGTLHVPYIALIDGITMGGGVGLSVHGNYRVATEKTLFAMPETRIGLFPDVGGTYFLPRLGGKLGLYLALTGYRLKGGDVYKAGIATHMCSTTQIEALEQDLISLDPKTSTPHDIEKILTHYHQQCPEARKPLSLEPQLPLINSTFSAPSIEKIINNLEKDASDWSKSTLETLSTMSPTSLKITLKGLQLGAVTDLQGALVNEFRLAVRCCSNHDFIEGVRALLVDKDNSPKWKPNSLDGVTDQMVENYFSPLSDKEDLTL